MTSWSSTIHPVNKAPSTEMNYEQVLELRVFKLIKLLHKALTQNKRD